MRCKPFQAVIFDCDGVLVDTEMISHWSWQQALRSVGLERSLEDFHVHFTGHATEVNLVMAETWFGRPLPPGFTSRVHDLFWQRIQADLPLIPGVETVLASLALPLATATNARRAELEFKLLKTGLGRYFQHTVCVDDVPHPKPAPDLYRLAAEQLGVDPQRCAVVEDSPAGIQAGVAAGMTVFSFCRDMDEARQRAAGAHHCFDDMGKLLALLSD
jgi:HAD superfamily hydrolase (TIGR01509 family)